MALIKCKECGKEISGTAESCPHCGYRTAHGRSITEAKVLLVQWIIFAILIVVGFVLVFGNFKPLVELYDEWDNSWYQASGTGFLKFLSYKEEEGRLYKFIFGVAFLIGGIIDMFRLKNKANSIQGNGFDAERRSKTYTMSQLEWNAASQQEWKCPDCGRVNKNYVSTCACGRNQNDRTAQAAGGSDSNTENKDRVTCPGCGADCGGDSRFCTMCGVKLKD